MVATTNMRIKRKNEWKVALKTLERLFEPMIMFFGLINSPLIF